jgi:endonuclease/exonuclease/phosphatase family metal-dependent hydrolase
MKRPLVIVGSVVGLLLLGFVLFFFWASSGRLPAEDLAQVKRYDAAPASAERDTFTVMTYNLGYLSGMTNNEPVVRPDSLFERNMDRAVDLIRDVDPDVLALQEVDYGGARVNHVHQLDTLATRLGFHSAAQAVNWDERYLPYPYGLPSVHFGRTLSGQSILSRYPIRRHARKVLPRPPQFFLRDAFYLSHLAQFAVVDIGGWPLVLINLHLEAFDQETREEQARRVVELYRGLAQTNLPVIMLGDVNSVAPTAKTVLPPEQRRAFAGDETVELLLNGTNLTPLFAESAYATGQSINTYPSVDPNRKIDYIFHRSNLVVPIDQEIRCGGSPPPSDHCAVAMTFMLPRPKPLLPDERIPDRQLPSLEQLLGE